MHRPGVEAEDAIVVTYSVSPTRKRCGVSRKIAHRSSSGISSSQTSFAHGWVTLLLEAKKPSV